MGIKRKRLSQFLCGAKILSLLTNWIRRKNKQRFKDKQKRIRIQDKQRDMWCRSYNLFSNANSQCLVILSRRMVGLAWIMPVLTFYLWNWVMIKQHWKFIPLILPYKKIVSQKSWKTPTFLTSVRKSIKNSKRISRNSTNING